MKNCSICLILFLIIFITENSKAIKLCGHRLSNKLEKICAGATCENNFSEEEELEAYFEGLSKLFSVFQI
jgi:CRISPR/Cas system-associated protein Csm6